MNISIQEAYQEALIALGEQIVERRFLAKQLIQLEIDNAVLQQELKDLKSGDEEADPEVSDLLSNAVNGN